jgi:hypothetical protein
MQNQSAVPSLVESEQLQEDDNEEVHDLPTNDVPDPSLYNLRVSDRRRTRKEPEQQGIIL